MPKVWTVYEVSNTVNPVLYIGVHLTENPNDSYLGSGKKIKQAILELGSDKFSKRILGVFEDKKDAYALERELVTWDRIWSGELYNKTSGGHGGWDLCNSDPRILDIRNSRLGEMAKISRQRVADVHRKNPEWAKNRNKGISEGLKKRYAEFGFTPTFTGKKHSEETKKKMSETHKITSAGERNSQFGTIWITDGQVSKKIKRNQEIPVGWKKGFIFQRKNT